MFMRSVTLAADVGAMRQPGTEFEEATLVYLTQLVYVKPGKEAIFNSFEDAAIPLIAKHGGELLLRVRPTKDGILAAGIDVPDEIHLVRFKNEDDFAKFSEDDERQQALHLKDQSVRAVILVKGTTELSWNDPGTVR